MRRLTGNCSPRSGRVSRPTAAESPQRTERHGRAKAIRRGWGGEIRKGYKLTDNPSSQERYLNEAVQLPRGGKTPSGGAKPRRLRRNVINRGEISEKRSNRATLYVPILLYFEKTAAGGWVHSRKRRFFENFLTLKKVLK